MMNVLTPLNGWMRLRRLRVMLQKLTSKQPPPSSLANFLHHSTLARAIFTTILFLVLLHITANFRRSHNLSSNINGQLILSHPFASNIIVSELNNFIFCPIPKAANSNWKYLIRKFEGLHDYPDLIKAHDHNTSGLRYLSDYSPQEVQRMLTDPAFFKFVFVRNPFKRLASCYMDKFLNTNPTYVHTEYRSFLAQLFTWHYARNVDIYHQPRPSFQSFVDELTKQQPPFMNAHWMPQVIHCGLGLIPYDFIGRMEQLDQHAAHVLKVIGKTEHHFPTQEEIGFLPSGTTRSAVSTLYNPDLVAKVRALYDMDIDFLGYRPCDTKRDFLACIME